MRKLIIFFLIFSILSTEAFAYIVKVYDKEGQRIGSYRKVGKEYILYDLNNNQVKTDEDLVHLYKHRQIPIENLQTFYDDCGDIIGTWSGGYTGSNGAACIQRNIYTYYGSPMIYEDTRFPKFNNEN